MLRQDLLSTEDRAEAILGYPAEQLVLPSASYPTFIASKLTLFRAFVPRVELGGWVPLTTEITYTDAFGSVIREILPAAEDEDIPFVPKTVESICLSCTCSAKDRERHGEDYACFPSCLSESPCGFVMP